MKKGNKQRKNPIIFVLYAMAIIFGIYTIYSVYNSYVYISGLVSQGLVISDELSSVITYYVGTSSPYLFYTIVIASMGYAIDKLNQIFLGMNKCEEIEEEIIIEENNNDMEEDLVESLVEELSSENDDLNDTKTEI